MKKIVLDKDNKTKLYYQLYLYFVKCIERGELKLGDKLPSVRKLSEDHDISRNTVTKAYEELERAGYIYSQSKSGYFIKNPKFQGDNIAKNPEKKSKNDEIPTVDKILRGAKKNPNAFTEIIYESIDADSVEKERTFMMDDPFSVGEMKNEVIFETRSVEDRSILLDSGDVIKRESSGRDKSLSPQEDFIESYKSAIEERRNILMSGDENLQGDENLRVAVAAFLYEFRRMNVNPANIIMGTDISQILYNILSLDEIRFPSEHKHGLLQKAEKSVSQKITPLCAGTKSLDPKMAEIFMMNGIKVVTVGDDCSVLDDDEASRATVAFVSSKELSKDGFSRFANLSAWADNHKYRYIFSYDIDTNIVDIENYSAGKVDRTVYLSTFSALISKSVNISFAVLPDDLLARYKTRFRSFRCPLPLLDQCALTDYLLKGKLLDYLKGLEAI